MIIGWKRHFLTQVSQERPCIIVLDELPEKKEIQKRHSHKVCKAVCLNGKPCSHKPQTGLEFCKRHLKIYDP